MKRTPTIRLVAGREISERLAGRTVRIVTAIMTVVVVGAVVVPGLVRSSSSPTRVGLVGGRSQSLAQALRSTAALTGARVTIVNVASPSAARSALTRGSLDAALALGPVSATVEVAKSLSPATRALLAEVVDGAHQRSVLGRAGVPIATVIASETPVPFTIRALSPPPAQQAARDVAALAAGILLYVAMAMYGAAVATGVAQEKTSRAAEVLLAAIRPRQLLSGKVLGIGACGVGQLAIPVIAALIANAIVHSARVPDSVWVLLPVTLLWFTLGYVFYAFLFAAAGAMVARQEEVQFATAPLAFPLLLGYLLVYAVIASPAATWIRILSYVPPLAPTLMPARVAVGGVAWWEVPLDVVIMLIAISGVIRIAARIYEGALVRGGARLTWRAALRRDETSGGAA